MWMALLVVALGLSAVVAGAEPPTVSEASVKSAFLYKFTHLAKWPPGAMGSEGAPLAMCVVGRDSLAEVRLPFL